MQFNYGKTIIKYKILDNGCWNIVNYAIGSNGYPIINFRKKRCNVHRLIFLLENDCFDLDKKVVIRHTCDNKLCINPSHLISGSQKENMNDRNMRNRQAKGEKNGKAKLTNEQTELIKNAYKLKIYNQVQLAKIFNVTQANISEITRNL